MKTNNNTQPLDLLYNFPRLMDKFPVAVLISCCVALIYFSVGLLGLELAFVQQNISPVWPPAGVAIAFVWLFGYRLWPAITLGSFLVNLTTSIPLLACALMAMGNTLECLLAVWLCRRYIPHTDPSFSFISIVKFSFLAAGVAPVLSALIGVSTLYYQAGLDSSLITESWITWWAANATGILIFTPIILIWAQKSQRKLTIPQFIEYSLAYLLTILICGIIFNGWFNNLVGHQPLTFLIVPTILWLVFRAEKKMIALQILIVTLMSVWGTTHGHGPYYMADMNQSLLILQSFLAMLALASLSLGSLVERNRSISAKLKVANTLLGERVKEQDIQLDESSKERQKATAIIHSLAGQSMSSSEDEEFFRQCVKDLADFYEASHAYIGVLHGAKGTSLKTIATYAKGKFLENSIYKLQGSPCGDVLTQNVEHINTGVQSRYPEDMLIQTLQVDSYFATPLISPNGATMGVLGVMHESPMQVKKWARKILYIFAGRISQELVRKRSEELLHGMATKLSYQASHDSLTNLINRREFDLRLAYTMERVRRKNSESALCYLDLDQFKIVNDTCGHAAGDALLKELTLHLKKVIRESDVLARLGGDEFGVILNDCPFSKAKEIAENLRETVQSFRFHWQTQIFEIAVSIGLVPLVGKCEDMSEVMIAADSACYIAKEQGRNRIHVYQHDDIDLKKRHGEMQWVNRIRDALKSHSFVLYTQEIRALSQDIGSQDFEVLTRMYDKESGEIIPPGAFIPAAERYNLMSSIDKEVASAVFDWLETHPALVAKIGLCTINISGQSLNDVGYLDFIVDRLEQQKFRGEKICFEITETAAVANLHQAISFMQKLKTYGCLFALDDFGSGMSSFAYLKALPVDYVKIDGYFVRDIVEDKIDCAMVEAIHMVANVMGLKTIAEFVENDDILNKLKSIGVDYVQGYGISKPQPIETFTNKVGSNLA